ncbi:MAG: hypothetical protein KDC45_01240 [Bacteroidetes bacterium]|nr:hypothetical protein [Bacteroidota bacterium]
MNQRTNNEKGSILVTTVFFVSLLTAAGLTIVVFTQNSTQLVSSDVGVKQSFQVCQAGIEYAVRKSFNTNNWHWSATHSGFSGGNVDVTVEDSTVIAALKDTLQVRVTGTAGSASSKQMFRIRLSDISAYAVYISGDLNSKVTVRDSDGTPNPARAFDFATEMPTIDADLLRQISISQGHYFSSSYSMPNNGIYPSPPDSGFYHVRPNGTVSDTPNVVYINGDLEVKNGAQIAGIVVVTGDVDLKNSQRVNGILYLPNPVSVVQDVDLYNKESVYGGIIGSGNITGLGNPDKISVYHIQSYLSKFYGLFNQSGLPYVAFYRFWREY